MKRLLALALLAFALAAPSARAAAVPRPDALFLVDTSSSAGGITAQSTAYQNSSSASYAFDGNKTSRWLAKKTGGAWYFVYGFNVATRVNAYRLYNATANNPTTRPPKNWTFSGSNDGENWSTLDTRTDETGWASGEMRDYRFENDASYLFYKFNCTANNGDSTYLQLYEVEFCTGTTDVLLEDLTTSTSGSASSWSASSSSSYTGDKAFDGDTSTEKGRWLASRDTSMFVVYRFNQATTVNGLGVLNGSDILGGVDSSGRSPKAWTFSGSNDGETWTVLDTQTGETGWSSSGEERYYQFINETPYEYYKFNCTALNDDESSNVDATTGKPTAQTLQLRELAFYYYNSGTPQCGDLSLARTGVATYSISATEFLNTANVMSWIADDGISVPTTNEFAWTVAEGTTETGSISGLAADKTYQISVRATNGLGSFEDVAGTLYTGELTLGGTTDANENGLVAGTVSVSREYADPWPLTVNYTVSSSVSGAAEGTTWAAPSPVTIPAGATTGYLLVTPLIDSDVTEDVEVTVTLTAGNYEIPSANTATLDILNLGLPAGYNTWIATAPGLASVGSNWSENHAPTSSENVLFDGRFSNADCEWDAAASATVASWTQTADYTGTVTFDTKYPVTGDPFQTFTVTGACVVNGGTWTHPLSVNMDGSLTVPTIEQLRAAYTYRLCVAADSFTLGSGATINVAGKGHGQLYVKGRGTVILKPAHGGRNAGSSVPCYGNPKYPEDVGYASNLGTDNANKCAPGGGAVKLTVTGACVVDGTITVDGKPSSGSLAAGAAGSILIEATSVSGTGSIFARAVSCNNNSYPHGVGGRIALLTTNAVDTAALNISAGAAGDFSSASGTVYLRDGTMTNGVLVVRNRGRTYSDPIPGRRTEVTADGDWTFDRIELGGDVQLAVPCGKTLSVPGWDCISAPYNASSTASGLYYIGGTLDFGSAESATLSGHWYFAPISNYVFNANVSLADGASIGFGGKYPQKLANNAYPDNLDRIHCTVNGNLAVPAGCAVNVNLAGAMQDSNYIPSGYPLGAHGGRRSNTMKTIGSVFHPRTLPHGQSNSYGHIIPGGGVELVVTGTFTLGGNVTATAYTGNDGINSQVGGGSIDIAAGRLVGTGSIKAGAVKNGQPGGRIAIRLTGAGATLDDFEGMIDCATLGAGSVGSCGSVYVETAADGEGRGTIVLDDNNVTCTTYTPICATGYAADDLADFRHANLIVRNQAKAQVSAVNANGTFTMDNIEIDETGALDLFGSRFFVTSAKIAGRNVKPGTYTAAQLSARGFTGVVDTSDGTDGTLVVTGHGTVLIVK